MAMLPGRTMGRELSSSSFGLPTKSRDMSFGHSSFNIGLGGLSGISGLNSSSLEEAVTSKAAASGLRSPMDVSLSSLSTTASFYGSGISDLRAALVAQQKQVDGLVDKVAVLFSAMHAEVLQDVRSACQHGGGELQSRLDALHRMEAEVDSRLAELREAEAGLREWLQGELQALHEQVRDEVQDGIRRSDVHDTVSEDLQGMERRIANLEEDVNFVAKAPTWEPALEQVRLELHDDLRDRVLQENLQGPLIERLHALEERLLETEIASSGPATAAELATHRDHLGQLEIGVQRGQAAVQHLSRVSEQMQGQWAEWRPWIEKKLESIAQHVSSNGADVKARLDMLDQWRHRQEDSLVGRDPLRERMGSLEKQVDFLQEKIESVTDSVQKAKKGSGEKNTAVENVKERVDALAATSQQEAQRLKDRVDALTTTSQQEAQRLQQETQRLQQRLNDVMRLGVRIDGTEAGLEAIQRQLLQQRGEQWSMALKPQQPDSLMEARFSQLQSQAQRSTEELKQDLEHRLSQMQDQNRRFAEELRQDIEAQRSQVQSLPQHVTEDVRRNIEHLTEDVHRSIETGIAETQAAAKLLVGNLQSELEPQVNQMYSASQRLVDELRQEFEGRFMYSSSQRLVDELRQEFDGRFSQVQSTSQRSQDELRQELESRYAQLRGAADGVNDELSDLQQELEAQIMQSMAESQSAVKAMGDQVLQEVKKITRQAQEELEARFAKIQSTTSSSTSKFADQVEEIGQSLEVRLDGRIEARMSQTHSFAQRLMNELRQDVETHVQQTHSVSQQLVEHVNQNSKDTQLLSQGFQVMQEMVDQVQQSMQNVNGEMSVGSQPNTEAMEARISQVRGAVQRLAEDVSERVDSISALRDDVGKMQMDMGQDLDLLKEALREVQQLVLKLQGEQDDVSSNAVVTAREAADEAVATLSQQLQQELEGSLARCDAGAAGCERVVQEALSKVGMMEGQLRSIATDLRSQLAQEGGTLIEALGSSMRFDRSQSPIKFDRSQSPDPAARAAVAARDMLTGVSPGSVSRREPAIGDVLHSTPPSGRPPRSSHLPLTMDASSKTPEKAPLPAVVATLSRDDDDLQAVTQRLRQQEQAMEDLRELHVALQGEVEGFLLERRVTRSLAGLERRGRSPHPLTIPQDMLGARRACSLDGIRITNWN